MLTVSVRRLLPGHAVHVFSSFGGFGLYSYELVDYLYLMRFPSGSSANKAINIHRRIFSFDLYRSTRIAGGCGLSLGALL